MQKGKEASKNHEFIKIHFYMDAEVSLSLPVVSKDIL